MKKQTLRVIQSLCTLLNTLPNEQSLSLLFIQVFKFVVTSDILDFAWITDLVNLRDGKLKVKLLGLLHPAAFQAMTENW